MGSNNAEILLLQSGLKSSKVLNVDTLTLPRQPADSYTILCNASSSTSPVDSVRWLPGRRLTRLLLRALGPNTLDSVTNWFIKKRLSIINSQIDARSREDRAWSKTDAHQTRLAYHDLVELSSGSYGGDIKIRAIFLRLTILRVIIHTQPSWLKPGRFHQTFRDIWTELDSLESHFASSRDDFPAADIDTTNVILKTDITKVVPHCLRRVLTENVTAELSSAFSRMQTDSCNNVENALSGTNLILVLCRDLAYDIGGYEVQNALACVSYSSWGVSYLRVLDQESRIIYDAVERLLTVFDSAYSRAMAFRIFGHVAASPKVTTSSKKTNRIGYILAGPSGIGRLLDDLASESLQFAPRHFFGTRVVESLCDALSIACSQGFSHNVVQHGTCEIIVSLLDAFINRDPIVKWYIEEQQTDHSSIERDQISAIKLILNILGEKEGKDAMMAAGAETRLWKFHNHPNRDFSDWNLKLLTGEALRKLA